MSKNKKRVFLTVAVAIMVIVLAAAVLLMIKSNGDEEPSLKEVLEGKLVAYETDLTDSLNTLNSNDAVVSYLTNWAKNKDIPASVDESGNVIFTLKASKDYEKAPQTAVVCSFNADNIEDSVEEIAVAMCVAKNAVNHGKLSVVFLSDKNGLMEGAKGFDIGHFGKETSVFYLGDTTAAKVATKTGAYDHYVISHKLDYEKPSYNKAYKITMKHCSSQTIAKKNLVGPNPIKTLGSVLANFKSTSLPFELASFSGGKNQDVSPKMASMTVVINDSDNSKFTKKMDRFIEKFYEKFGEKYPEIEYSYEEVKLPSKVIAQDDTDNLVSLMYTMFDGTYYNDDNGDAVAMINVGKISTKEHRLKIDISATSYDLNALQEIREAYETICGLCDVKYKCVESYPLFDSEEISSTMLTNFEEAFIDFTGDKEMKKSYAVEFTPCSILHEKNEELPMLYCGITEKSKNKFAGAIVTYLDQGLSEE